MPGLSLIQKIGNWEILATNLAEDLEQHPFLRELHVAFTGLIGRAKELESRQEAHKAMLRETNAERRKIERDGFELNRRLRSMLQGQLGPSSERLVRYGLKPRPLRNVRRKKPGEPATPPPAPTAPPASSTPTPQ